MRADAPAATVYPWEQPLGAISSDGRTPFRVWAPRAESLALRVRGEDLQLADVGHGVFEIEAEAEHDENYIYVVDGEELPDPCTRWQPDGLRGPSRVPDPSTFAWSDDGFTPPALEDVVLYELHVGTFSPEGSFEGVIPRLAGLAEI